MASPQTGIFALGTASHAYLELDLVAWRGPGRRSSPRSPRSASRGRRSAASTSSPASGPSSGRRSRPTRRRAGVPGFDGCRRRARWRDAAGHAARRRRLAERRLATTSCSTCRGRSSWRSPGRAVLAHEIVGWPYHHDLDLTGFIDGTENPTLVEATAVAVVPHGVAGEGASVLLLQQWEHDAIGWEALPVDAQEAIIGRRKADSEELDPRPPTSHVARTDQDTLRQDLPPERRVRDAARPRDDLRRLLPRASDAPESMLESMVGIGGPARRADERDPSADRRVLRHPVGRRAGAVRGRGPMIRRIDGRLDRGVPTRSE